MDYAIANRDDQGKLKKAGEKVAGICDKYPLY
jgi:hypothetical protein